MNSKKLFHIITILTAGIAIALTGTLIATKLAKKQEETTATFPQLSTSVTSVSTTQPRSTTVPRETVPIGGNSVITTVTETKPLWKIEEEASISASIAQSKAKTTTKKGQQKTTKKASGIVPQSRADIIEAYLKGVNNLKKTKNFSLIRQSKSKMNIEDITGGYLVQQVAQTLAKYEDVSLTEDFDFRLGVDSSTGFTPNDVIPPYEGTAKLKDSAVHSTSAKALADGGYTITIKLKSETQSYDHEPASHKAITEISDNIEEKFRSVEIENYELNYNATTITALFDKNNRITYIEHYVPISDATVTGMISYVPLTVSFSSEDIVQYDITY